EWIAARENIGSKTATSDLSVRLNSTANQSHTDSRAGAGFEQSQSISADITLSKNLYDGGQTKQNMRLAEIELQTASATFAKAEQKLILETVESYLAVIKARREVNL
ncbi:MAG: TolC family protein, partial [Candidatus Puniceispirillum sp.]